MASTGLAAAAAFAAYLLYCRFSGIVDGDRGPFAVSARWAAAATTSWTAVLALLWCCRGPLKSAALRSWRSRAGLFAASFVPMLLADALSFRLNYAMSGWTASPQMILAQIYRFAPSAAMLSAILLLLLVLWASHGAQRETAGAETRPAWLELPEAPLLKLRVEEVSAIRSAGNYSELICGRRSHCVRVTMSGLSERLRPLGFVRVHRTTLVNIRHVAEIGRDRAGRASILLFDGTRIAVGPNYRQAIAELVAGS